QFLRALEHCRKNKGHIQHFIVLRVDRFARSTEDHFSVRKLLQDYGVTLHSVTEAIGNSPTEKFIETVLAGAAEYENAVRKQRCVDGMMTKISQGLFPWMPPLGYLCGHSKKRGEKKLEPDKPDGEVFPILQRALNEYADGLWSQRQLAQQMDEWGLAKIRGKKTPPQLIDRLLGANLKFYAGMIVNPWTREEHRGLHQPMITEDEFNRVRLRRAGKRVQPVKAKRDRHNPLFPLRRTLQCSACRRQITGSVSRGHGGQYAYYHCATRGCAWYGKAVPKARLETAFLEYLERITPGESFWAAFNETVIDYWREQGTRHHHEAVRWRHRLDDLEERRKRIFEMREDGVYSREEFTERKEEVETEVAAARIALREARMDDFDVEAALYYAAQFVRTLPQQWLNCSPELRERFQQVVFPEGIPFDRTRGFGTSRFGFIYQLYLMYLEQKSAWVCLLYQARTYF
ncbi:MAG: recombinase family protein, partial [Dehalococcoidia bacterium]|nr:recombinase family protein [Dehalococcoidia bacterium]